MPRSFLLRFVTLRCGSACRPCERCFEIFNLFAANQALVHEFETTGDEDPEKLSDPANSLFLKLHQELAEALILEKLLRLCMPLRTYDDIVGQSPHAERYADHVKKTKGDDESSPFW
jgi:hypothetical protein